MVRLALVAVAMVFVINCFLPITVDAVQVPTGCSWVGTPPICDGQCADDEQEINKDGCGDGACCYRGTKSLCCNM